MLHVSYWGPSVETSTVWLYSPELPASSGSGVVMPWTIAPPMNGPLAQVVVTGVGHWRGEGLALVEKAG